jgi:hypothetical protein
MNMASNMDGMDPSANGGYDKVVTYLTRTLSLVLNAIPQAEVLSSLLSITFVGVIFFSSCCLFFFLLLRRCSKNGTGRRAARVPPPSLCTSCMQPLMLCTARSEARSLSGVVADLLHHLFFFASNFLSSSFFIPLPSFLGEGWVWGDICGTQASVEAAGFTLLCRYSQDCPVVCFCDFLLDKKGAKKRGEKGRRKKRVCSVCSAFIARRLFFFFCSFPFSAGFPGPLLAALLLFCFFFFFPFVPFCSVKGRAAQT